MICVDLYLSPYVLTFLLTPSAPGAYSLSCMCTAPWELSWHPECIPVQPRFVYNNSNGLQRFHAFCSRLKHVDSTFFHGPVCIGEDVAARLFTADITSLHINHKCHCWEVLSSFHFSVLHIMFPVSGAAIRNSNTQFNDSWSIEAKLWQQVREFEWKHWQIKIGTKILKTYFSCWHLVEWQKTSVIFIFSFYPFRSSNSILFWLPVIAVELLFSIL